MEVKKNTKENDDEFADKIAPFVENSILRYGELMLAESWAEMNPLAAKPETKLEASAATTTASKDYHSAEDDLVMKKISGVTFPGGMAGVQKAETFLVQSGDNLGGSILAGMVAINGNKLTTDLVNQDLSNKAPETMLKKTE